MVEVGEERVEGVMEGVKIRGWRRKRYGWEVRGGGGG